MKLSKCLAALAIIVAPLGVQAATKVDDFDVNAFDHSTTDGTGLGTGITLTTGQSFSVDAAEDDFWALCPFSACLLNADGEDQFGNAPFGTHTQNGLTLNFGTLVGQIGTGDFFELGTDFDGTAANDGELFLYAFDSNNFDNSASIGVRVTAEMVMEVVPLPATGLLLLGALAGAAGLRRKRRAS